MAQEQGLMIQASCTVHIRRRYFIPHLNVPQNMLHLWQTEPVSMKGHLPMLPDLFHFYRSETSGRFQGLFQRRSRLFKDSVVYLAGDLWQSLRDCPPLHVMQCSSQSVPFAPLARQTALFVHTAQPPMPLNLAILRWSISSFFMPSHRVGVSSRGFEMEVSQGREVGEPRRGGQRVQQARAKGSRLKHEHSMLPAQTL